VATVYGSSGLVVSGTKVCQCTLHKISGPHIPNWDLISRGE